MRSAIFNLGPPLTANAKVRGGYQVHKELEKYGNKVGGLEQYPQREESTIQAIVLRGVGQVLVSSFPKTPLAGGGVCR